MKKFPFILLICTGIFLTGCETTDDEMLTFDLKKHPGIAVIGNDRVTVIYSDDERTFDQDSEISGGIQTYSFNQDAINYIQGSMIEFIDNDGPVTVEQDTFGIDPFFSPFQVIENSSLRARSRIFVTEDDLTVQQISIIANDDLNISVQWTIKHVTKDDTVTHSSTDILEDGIYHRYDNDVIIALAATNEQSQYSFDDRLNISTITTPLSLSAGSDTTLTFFIAPGMSDTDVITKMFAAEEDDLFLLATTNWQNWLRSYDIPKFPHHIYQHIYTSNLYASYAMEFNGADQFISQQIQKIPAASDIDLLALTIEARDYILTGDMDKAEPLIKIIIENTNSYGLLPAKLYEESTFNNMIVPSPESSSGLVNTLQLYLQNKPI